MHFVYGGLTEHVVVPRDDTKIHWAPAELLDTLTRKSRSPSPVPADCVMVSDTSWWTPCQNDRATAARCVDLRLPKVTTLQTLHGICVAKSSVCRVWPAQQQPSERLGNRVWVCSQPLGRPAHMSC